MPVKSYLVQTAPGRCAEVAGKAAAIDGCTVLPAENAEALIVVTDTVSEEAETGVRARLESIDGLQALTLVAAFTADDDLISLFGKGSKPE